MPDLYPVFEVPEELVEDQAQQAGVPSPLRTMYFDFETGDISLDGKGSPVMVSDQDAYKQWAQTCIMTERYQHLIHSTDFGVEIEPIIQGNYPRGIAESEIRRTITEALSVDPRTVAVDNFTFGWKGDSVWINCVVESIYGQVELTAQIGGV